MKMKEIGPRDWGCPTLDPPLGTFEFFQQYKSPVTLLLGSRNYAPSEPQKWAVRILLECFLVDRCEDFQNLRWGQDPNNEDDWKQYDFYDQLVTAEVSVKFITGRNEVVAKVMFLQVSVCPQGGEGVCLSACWDARPPPRPGTHTPRTRQTPPPDQADTPRTRQTPPGTRQTPTHPRTSQTHPLDQADPPRPGRPP